MKKVLFIAMLFVLPMAFAQPGNKGEKVEKLKIAFITNELELTTDEAKLFWPVYNELQSKLREEKKTQKNLAKYMRDNEASMAESDYKSKSNAFLESELTEAQLRKEYHNKIADVVGYKKATKLISAEKKFKRELLKKINKGPQPGGKPGPGRPRPN